MPSTNFCAQHTNRGGGANPLGIWRAPVEEMPPELVAAIRRAAPEATFPAQAPQAVEDIEAPGSAAAAHLNAEPGPAQLDWLLDSLRQTIHEVLAVPLTRTDQGPNLREALQKANTITRLGVLYLKTHQAAVQERTSQQLLQRLAELEQRLAAVETHVNDRQADESVPGAPVQAEQTTAEPDPAEQAVGGGSVPRTGLHEAGVSPESAPVELPVQEKSHASRRALAVPARASP